MISKYGILFFFPPPSLMGLASELNELVWVLLF